MEYGKTSVDGATYRDLAMRILVEVDHLSVNWNAIESASPLRKVSWEELTWK